MKTFPSTPDDSTAPDDYSGVVRFIPKNTGIPKKLRSFEQSPRAQLQIKQLMRAIEQGLLDNDALFCDPDCGLYLLKLLEAKKISIEQFLTVQIYLSALMEYTDKQPVKKEDEDIKIKGEVKLVNFDDIKHLLIDHLEKCLGGKKCSPQVTKTILDTFKRNAKQKRSALDNIVFKIKFLDARKTFLKEILERPLIFEHKGYFYIPSVAVMTLILRSIHGDNSELPVKVYPIYGEVKPSTLFQLHKEGFHPICLYFRDVTSNPRTVHGLRAGALSYLLHDLAFHFFKGNITFTKTVYSFVYNYLIEKVLALFQLSFDKVVLEKTEEKTEQMSELSRLIDLNMNTFSFPTKDYADDRLATVLLEVVGYEWNAPLRTNEKIFQLFEMLENDKTFIQKKYHIDLRNILTPAKTESPSVFSNTSYYNALSCDDDNKLIEASKEICSVYYTLYLEHKLNNSQNKTPCVLTQEDKPIKNEIDNETTKLLHKTPCVLILGDKPIKHESDITWYFFGKNYKPDIVESVLETVLSEDYRATLFPKITNLKNLMFSIFNFYKNHKEQNAHNKISTLFLELFENNKDYFSKFDPESQLTNFLRKCIQEMLPDVNPEKELLQSKILDFGSIGTKKKTPDKTSCALTPQDKPIKNEIDNEKTKLLHKTPCVLILGDKSIKKASDIANYFFDEKYRLDIVESVLEKVLSKDYREKLFPRIENLKNLMFSIFNFYQDHKDQNAHDKISTLFLKLFENNKDYFSKFDPESIFELTELLPQHKRRRPIEQTLENVKENILNYIDRLDESGKGCYAVFSGLFKPYSNSEKIDVLMTLILEKPLSEKHEKILKQDSELETLYTRFTQTQKNLDQHPPMRLRK